MAVKIAWLAVLPAIALCCTAREPTGVEGHPSIVVLSLDTLRPDHLSSYGYPRDTSPNLMAFAGEAVRFESALSQSCATLPSHLSLITSLNPPHFRITRNDGRNDDQHTTELELPASVLRLTDVLRGQGYLTLAFTGGVFVGERHGFSRGFEGFREVRGRVRARSEGFSQSIGALGRYLDGRSPSASGESGAGAGRPFFLFLHTYDVHAPYNAPPPWARRFSRLTLKELERQIGYPPMPSQIVRRLGSLSDDTVTSLIDLYDNGIASTDARFGELVELLRAHGLYEDAIIVVLADHGEEFREHGFLGHGHSVHGELIRVPLMIRLPKARYGGRVIRTPVALVDVAPTVLELAGLEIPAEFQGRSLVSSIETGGEGDGNGESRIYFETPNARNGSYGMQRGRWKLIRHRSSDRIELYDVSTDRGERTDLADAEPSIRDALASELEAWVAEMETEGRRRGWNAILPHQGERRAVTHEEQQALRALGYVD